MPHGCRPEFRSLITNRGSEFFSRHPMAYSVLPDVRRCSDTAAADAPTTTSFRSGKMRWSAGAEAGAHDAAGNNQLRLTSPAQRRSISVDAS